MFAVNVLLVLKGSHQTAMTILQALSCSDEVGIRAAISFESSYARRIEFKVLLNLM